MKPVTPPKKLPRRDCCEPKATRPRPIKRFGIEVLWLGSRSWQVWQWYEKEFHRDKALEFLSSDAKCYFMGREVKQFRKCER